MVHPFPASACDRRKQAKESLENERICCTNTFKWGTLPEE